MSNDLIPSGGGAIVPGTGGAGAVGDYVGDVSMDRGGGTAGAVVTPEVVRELQGALGFNIGPEQIQKAGEVLYRDRARQDHQQKQATVKAMRAAWGASGYEQRTRRIVEWLKTLPGDLGEEIRDARDQSGDLIANKPAALRAMYEVAAATILGTDDDRDRAACERALQAEWKGAYHSHIATVKRFLDTVPRSVREGLLNARDDNDVATTNDPQALKWLLQLARPRLEVPRGDPAPDMSAINGARRREIEKWMGAPRGSADYKRYWEDNAVQTEYRELTGHGVTNESRHSTGDSDVERRIKEIESWMGTKRYTNDEAVQRELRELYDRRDRAQQSRR
jgi:hypothetical protein